MLEQADEIDKKKQEELDKLAEENEKIGGYTKLQPYNKPVYLIVLATIGSIINGAVQPVLGIVFAKILTLLCTPKEYLEFLHGKDHLQDEVTKLSLFMVYCAIVNGVSIFFTKYSFGFLGNKVTLKVRELLYINILQKNIGWFDNRDNGPSVLTSILSADAAAINGVGGESIGPIAESAFGVVIGIAVAFYFCWQEAVVCLLVAPIMIVGPQIDMEQMKAADADNKDATKEADLLCGDSIVNYKTVQSFGHEDKLVEKYRELLEPVHKKKMSSSLKSGAAFGCSQFSQYLVFGVMFFFGGLIIKNSVDEDTGEVKIKADDVFISLFAIMFGANAAGNAASFGPDMEKAEAAAKKIFRVIEVPSEINAVAMDEKKDKRSIDLDKVRGEIEFREVWFRYPTRKEDFVLRGLNLKVNPNEQVALVGESGCGKSTFVNLLMRFYDADFGTILFDGVDIREYNLHDLRKAISLVMQEPIVFNYSILENILYGKPDASNDEVYNATTISNANEFIEGEG
jgi:ATP-binding cassette, subfamily B (MDR/TAP), member 1